MTQDVEGYLDSKGWRYKRHENSKGTQLLVELCPFCAGGDGRDKWTFAVLEETGAANCKRGKCGWQGSFLELQRAMGDAPQQGYRPPARPKFVKVAKQTKTYTKPANDVEARHQALLKSAPMVRYLTGMEKREVKNLKGKAVEAQGRGFSKAMIERFKLGLDDGKWIAIPYFRDGELVRTKYRTIAKDFRIDAGTEPVLFNIDQVTGSTVAICEGEFDVIALTQCGIEYAVSVPDGCADTAWIDHNWEWLSEKETIVIAVDTDEGGQGLEREIVNRLGRDRCLRVKFPHKDANGCLQAGMTPEEVAAMVRSAEPYPMDTLRKATDLYDEVYDLYTGEKPWGTSTGWPALDQILGGIRMGEVTVVTGPPSSGKSEWVNALLVNLASKGMKSVVASLENPTAKVIRNQVCQYTGKPFHGPKRLHEAELVDALVWLDERIAYVDLADEDQSWDAVEDHIRYAARRFGCKIAVVDPLTMLLGNSRKDDERFDIDNIMRRARRLVTSLGIHLIIVAHPKKLANDNAVAELYDISGSAGVRNLTWNGISVWRDRESEKHGRNRVKIYVKKNREFGMEGVVELIFDPLSKRYDQPLYWHSSDYQDEVHESPQTPAAVAPGLFSAQEEGADRPPDDGNWERTQSGGWSKDLTDTEDEDG